MRLSSASIRAFLHFFSARQQVKIDITITMARGSSGKGKKTPRTKTSTGPLHASKSSLSLLSSPSDVKMPILSSTDPISRDYTDTGSQSSLLDPLEDTKRDIPEPSASADPKRVIIGTSDSQDAQGLVNSPFSDGEKPSTQVTEDRSVSTKKKKRSRKNAKKGKAQRQGSQNPEASSKILPLDYYRPMPAPITSSEPDIGSPRISPSLAFAKPTKAEETLRQENENLRRQLEEANCLARGLKEAHLQLEEEVEAWKQKCKGFSDAVEKLRSEVEGMIDSRISKFLNKMAEKAEGEGKEKEWKEGEKKLKEREEKEVMGKEKERKEKRRKEKGGNEKKGKGKEGKEEMEETKGWKEMNGKVGGGRAKEAELKARQEKNRESSLEQIQAYRQRKKQEERRGKKWWTRFQIKPVRKSRPSSPKSSTHAQSMLLNIFPKFFFGNSTRKLTTNTLDFLLK